jgi:hypothetical protein
VRSSHPGENKEIRLPRHFSIFNAEAEAINTAISITRKTVQPKTGDSQRIANWMRKILELDDEPNPKSTKRRST